MAAAACLRIRVGSLGSEFEVLPRRQPRMLQIFVRLEIDAQIYCPRPTVQRKMLPASVPWAAGSNSNGQYALCIAQYQFTPLKGALTLAEARAHTANR